MNIFEECLKCQKDFAYFVETYVKIQHPTRGIIPFNFYDFQKKVIDSFGNNRFVVIKKFRQGGFTTTAAIYGLWRCLFYQDQRVAFFTGRDREALALSDLIRKVYNCLPENMKMNISGNDHKKEFPITNSEMYFLTSSRGHMALTHLIIDEAAYITDMEKKWTALYPSLAPNGQCFVLSTLNKLGDWFDELYTNAANHTNQFVVVNTKYTDHPDFNNEEWTARVRKNLGEKLFAKEFEGCYIIDPKPGLIREKLKKIIDDNDFNDKEMLERLKNEIDLILTSLP